MHTTSKPIKVVSQGNSVQRTMQTTAEQSDGKRVGAGKGSRRTAQLRAYFAIPLRPADGQAASIWVCLLLLVYARWRAKRQQQGSGGLQMRDRSHFLCERDKMQLRK